MGDKIWLETVRHRSPTLKDQEQSIHRITKTFLNKIQYKGRPVANRILPDSLALEKMDGGQIHSTKGAGNSI
jgi:hypothetical protein